MELCNIIAIVRFATRKTELSILYNKVGIPVASQVSERLKTEDLRKLVNIRKISNLGREIKLATGVRKSTQKLISKFSNPIQFDWIRYFVANILSKLWLKSPRLKRTPILLLFLIFFYLFFFPLFLNQETK